VFEETLADWRKEAAIAAGPLARAWVAVRGSASVLRGVARVSCREATLIPASGLPGRFLLWLTVPQAAAVLIVWKIPVDVNLTERLLWCVISTAFFLPAALFVACALGGRTRETPALGAGLVAMSIAIPLLVWAVPSANTTLNNANQARDILQMEGTRLQRVEIPTPTGAGVAQRLAVAQALLQRVWPQAPLSFHFDWPAITQPASGAGIFPSWWRALQWLSFFGAYMALCVLLPWLAAQLKGRGRTLTAGVSLAVLWMLLYQPVWAGALSYEWLFLWMFFGFGTPWVPVFVVMLFGLTLGRRSYVSGETLPLGVA
jgi:hypothetical protein